MKVGIITYHFGHNYGAMLQAYAMQAALKEMGHEPYFVYLRKDFQFTNKYERRMPRSLKGFALTVVLRALRKPLHRRFERFEAFLAQELPLTRRYATEGELAADPPDLDAYVCGSDQIWNLQTGINEFFYGKYVPDGVRLVSYAPSFGNVDIPQGHTDKVRELLNRFHHLAVREESGCEMVRGLTGREVTRTIDPVFLIENRVWESLAIAPALRQPYIAFYALEMSARASAVVARIARMTKLPVVVIAKGGAFMLTCRTRLAIDAGPREFLGWLKGASMVLTNSFHATVFAIKFDVPFVTIAHSHRNARMENLLQITGLEDRLVHNESDLGAWTRERLLTPSAGIAEPYLAGEIESAKGFFKAALS
jgi:hypothetical protein